MGKYINIALIISLSIFMVFHFSMIFLQTGPQNPLSIKYGKLSKEYTEPLFVQTWNLFAPDPVEITQNILVQYKTTNNEVSEWHNITKPIIEANRSNVVSSYNRAARVSSGVYFGIFHMDEVIMSYKDKVSDEEFNKNIDVEQLGEGKSKQVNILYRFAFSSIPLITQEDVKEVRVRIMNENSIPYSERNNPNYERTRDYIDFDWREYTWVEGYL